MQTIGKYVLTRQIGAGGMGVVYEGRDPALNRLVAIKVLPPETGPNADTRRFRREAESAAQVNHPNCVQIYDIGEDHGRPFLVMELVSGVNAGVLVTRLGKLAWPEATRVAVAACRGLTAIHDRGLIHRDVKPTNLLVSEAGAVKLADFGLARPVSGHTLSLTGEKTIGTPHYMAPEQCMNEPVDARTDVYALGATYFHLLTGKPPFRGERDLQVMFAHCNNPVPDACALCPELPAACADLLRKALAKMPADRFQTAGEMQAALEAILGAAPTVAIANDVTRPTDPASDLQPAAFPPGTLLDGSTVPDTPTSPTKQANPTRRRVLLAAVPAVAAVIGTGAYFAFRKRDEPAPPGPGPGAPPAPGAKEKFVEVGGPVGSVAVSPDGRWLAAGLIEPVNGLGGTKLFDLRAGRLSDVRDGDNAACWSVAFSPDGRHFAAAMPDSHQVMVRDMRTNGASGRGSLLRGPHGDPYTVAFSGDSRLLAIGFLRSTAPKGSVRVWDVNKWPMDPTDVPCPEPQALAFAPNSSVFAAALKRLDAANVQLWDATTREPVPVDRSKLSKEPEPPDWAIGPSIAFAREKALLAFTFGRVIRVCAPPWFTEVGPSIRVAAVPRAVALSPDGAVLAAAVGSAIELWTAGTGAHRASLTGHTGTVLALAFSADGKTLFSGSSKDTAVRVWDVPPS